MKFSQLDCLQYCPGKMDILLEYVLTTDTRVI
jgi:hypothetical protein